MALSRTVKSSKVTEVTIDSPKERPSTQIHLNENFTIDLDDLNYKKNRDPGEPYTDRQRKKDQETNYLEEIDDGAKRLRSEYRSSTSINTLGTVPEPQKTDPEEKDDVHDELTVEDAIPRELLEENEKKGSEVLVQPGTSHSESLRQNQLASRIKGSMNLKIKSQKAKKTDDHKKANQNSVSTKKSEAPDQRRIKKKETKTKTSKGTKQEESRTDLKNTILSRADSSVQARSSVFKTSDAGNGIEIIIPSYLVPDDVDFQSKVWPPEERGLFLKDNNFSHVQKFQTDIFHIHKTHKTSLTEPKSGKGPQKGLCYPDIEPSNITIRVHLPEMSQMNGLCLKFHAYVCFKKQWQIVQTKYQNEKGTVTFHTNQMDSFCIVSTPRKDKLIITPDGYEYVSEADNRIKIDFPANTVSRDEEVNVRVIPLNRESMATKIESNPRNCFILAISECLSVRHSIPSFERPVEIQLPVDDLPGIESKNVECRYGVFRRRQERNFHLTDLEVIERNGVPTIAVSSFSEYVILKVRSDMFRKLQDLLPEEIEVAIGDKMCCKILFFVGSRKPNSMSVMLECITRDSLEDVIQQRKQLGYELVRQCPSPDFFFPVNQRIRVDVGGRFSLTKHIGKGYYFLTFFPIAADNFIIFPVEKYSGMETAVYGIISFKEDNGTKKDLHAIHYDPWSSRGKPTPRQPPLTSRSAPVSRQMTAASDVHKSQIVPVKFDDNFFSDKALLAIAQSLSPDSMFKVVINLDMTKAQYEQITNDYAQLTTSSKHLQLLKTALNISNEETKIQRLTSALRDSDENSLADKIEELYRENMKITRINLERKNTVVTIQSDK